LINYIKSYVALHKGIPPTT